MERGKYIFTLSCKDTTGIVAAVTTSLANMGAFITESSQFGDYSTGQFFMRSVFEIDKLTKAEIISVFKPVSDTFGMQWNLKSLASKERVLILVSKLEHCLLDILARYRSNLLPITIPLIVSNHKDVKPIAKMHDIPFEYLPITLENKLKQEKEILKLIDKHKIDLVVLARYMQVLSPSLCKKLEGKAINIHHSFLPSFKGAKPYHQAFDRGVKLIGASAHYVTEDLDEGPIIEQEIIRVNHSHKPEDLVTMGRDIENIVLSRAIKMHVERRVLIDKTKTVVFS